MKEKKKTLEMIIKLNKMWKDIALQKVLCHEKCTAISKPQYSEVYTQKKKILYIFCSKKKKPS